MNIFQCYITVSILHKSSFFFVYQTVFPHITKPCFAQIFTVYVSDVKIIVKSETLDYKKIHETLIHIAKSLIYSIYMC